MQSRWTMLVSTLAVAIFGCGDDSADGSGGSSGRGAQTGAGGGAVQASSGGELGDGECAWEGQDPGDLVATGSAVGDVIANVQGLIDQCGVARSLWDFAGGYRIVVLAEGW